MLIESLKQGYYKVCTECIIHKKLYELVQFLWLYDVHRVKFFHLIGRSNSVIVYSILLKFYGAASKIGRTPLPPALHTKLI